MRHRDVKSLPHCHIADTCLSQDWVASIKPHNASTEIAVFGCMGPTSSFEVLTDASALRFVSMAELVLLFRFDISDIL